MVGQERWEEIRRLSFGQHVTVSGIARRFDLDRKTVRRCLRQEVWRQYQRAPRTDTLLAEHEAFVRARAPEVGYSARILFQELTKGPGYSSSYKTVKRFVALLRALETQASI